jgi:16S rRNA (uracil1498-N3)-methyltransferase
MTRRRWIADEFTGDRAALIGEHAAHLARTLRARIGQQFEIACGDTVRQGTVTDVSEHRVEFALGEEVPHVNAVPITLLLAVFKFDRMEWAIEKCTELNVTTIVPVIARRTEKHLTQAAEKRVERWRRIAREASEQSRRLAPPEISAPVKLESALEARRRPESRTALPQLAAPSSKSVIPSEGFSPSGGTCCSSEGEMCIVLAETERAVMLADILRANAPQSLIMAIGPEGGWTPEELQSFAAAQFLSCSLGETILRAETAATAAVAIARAEI